MEIAKVTDDLVSQEMLANMACVVSDELGTASLNYVETLGGKLKLNGNPVIDNRLICIVLDYTRSNVLYTVKYNPNNTEYKPPDCFAIGRKPEDLVPHDTVVDKKSSSCKVCKYNQRGSASLIRADANKDARACSNKMRLALLVVGYVNKGGDVILDCEDITTSEIVFLSVPVMSTFVFQNYAKKLATVKKLPPCAVCTEITTNTEGGGFVINFNEVTQAKDSEGKLSKINIASPELFRVILERKKEAEMLLQTPYPQVNATTEKGENTEEIPDTKDF